MPRNCAQKPEKLIAAVRENVALYDPAQKNYGDFEVKLKLWSIVAEKCGLKTGLEAKMMWKNLRDCYRIYRNKLRYKPNARKWKYYQQLDFLAPYIRDRKFQAHEAVPPVSVVTGNVDVESGESVDLDKSIHINESEGKFTTIQYWNDTEAKFSNEEIRDEITQDQEEILKHSQLEEASPESAMDSEHESFEDILPEVLSNGPPNNSLKMFFDAMYASTCQLPPSLQRTVKKKIFAAVLEEEENADLIRASHTGCVQIKCEP